MDARPDKLGAITIDGIDTFYASGRNGVEARADGQGGFIERGYYYVAEGALNGPFRSRRLAVGWAKRRLQSAA